MLKLGNRFRPGARLLVAFWSITLLGAQPPPEIRVDVNAVNVLVSVTDAQGRFVTDLNRDRFHIYENGKLQPVTHFAQEVDLPLHIGLLIDTSASVRTKLDFEKQAATNFVRSVMRSQDQTLLVEFDSGVQMLSDFTNSPATIAGKIQDLKAGGGTSLLDAVALVSQDKMTAPRARKTIIIVSDGVDLNSRHNLAETLQIAQLAGVIVYAIGTSRFAASPEKKGEKTLLKLSEGTGGRAFFPYSPNLMEEAFELINTELRSQYSLTYTPMLPQRGGKFRKLRVKLTNGKRLNIRHRSGYYPAKLS